MKCRKLFLSIMTVALLTSSLAMAIKLKVPSLSTNVGSVANIKGTKADPDAINNELNQWRAKKIENFTEHFTQKYGQPQLIINDTYHCWQFVSTKDGKPFSFTNYLGNVYVSPSFVMEGKVCSDHK